MGELQFGLIAIGSLVVAGVFFYNKWQERRYRRQAEAAFGSRHEDVLMRSGGADGQRAESPVPDRIEPMLSTLGTAPGLERGSKQVLVDFADFIIPIESP